MQNEATVFIVADDKAVLKSLHWLVESFGYQVESFHTANGFLNTYQMDQVGVLLPDVQMPEIKGIELQKIMHERHITLPIIFITGHGNISMAVRTMKEGAIDFLTKPINNHGLLEAINRAINENLKQRDENRKKQAVVALVENLTPREYEVRQLMISDKSTKVIAYELTISSNTVDIHRTKVMKKMRVKTAAELATLVPKV